MVNTQNLILIDGKALVHGKEWQLVPVEPTEDMRLAMATHGVKHLEWAGDVYAAALAAAPKP